MQEKRKFARIQFRTKATICNEAEDFDGQIDNLSLNGMMLKTDHSLDIGQAVQISIYLSGSEPQLKISLSGIVVRQSSDGLAVQFDMDPMPLDTLTHLRHIIGYNSGDPDAVMKEYFNYLDQRNRD